MADLASYRLEHPTDDLTSALINTNIDGEALTHAELASFFILLVVAGNETTRNAITHGLLALSQYPDQRARWQADLEGVAPTAVEEIVRWATPVIWMRRTVGEDTVLRARSCTPATRSPLLQLGQPRRGGLRGPLHFRRRAAPNPHVGFGAAGPHFCLGAHLARREISVMFRELFARLPDITAGGEPDRLRSNFINGIKHLPCTFTPVAPRP